VKQIALYLAILMLALTASLAAPASAQISIPLAGVVDGQVVLTDLPAEPRQITQGEALNYADLIWSPDGQWLAFRQITPDYQLNQMLYNRAEDSVQVIAENVNNVFPMTFSANSSALYFVNINPETDPAMGPTQVMDIFALDLMAQDAQPEYTASFDFGVGCGGGSALPTDQLYTQDIGGLGGFFLVFELTPYGVVYSMDCGGSETGLLDLETGEGVSLGKASRVKVSPDKTQMIGIEDLAGTRENESVILVDLETRERIVLPVTASADQVAWGAAGTTHIFYSARQTTDVPLGSAEDRAAVETMFGSPMEIFETEATIHRFDLISQTDEVIYAAPAYAIGRIQVTPAGDALIFSQVGNLDQWLQAVGRGDVTLENAYNPDAAAEYVKFALLRLALSGEEEAALITLNQFGVALYPV
jgi:hypothetical protein